MKAIDHRRSAFARARRVRPGGAARRAFTLIELMVVTGIIILIVALAAPAFGPMLASNHRAATLSTLSSIFTVAQTAAIGQGTTTAVRFERAFKTHPGTGLMVDAAGNDSSAAGYQRTLAPVRLDYQQARILSFAPFKEYAFVHDAESKVHTLPKSFWLAPGYCLGWDATALAEAKVQYQPTYDQVHTTPYSLLDTFYVAFDSNGELTTVPYNWCNYRDATQAWIDESTGVQLIIRPMVDRPPNSAADTSGTARSLVLYERAAFEVVNPADGAARQSFLRTEGRAIYINRVTGSIVEAAR